MKTLLYAASIALAVTACTNDEPQSVDINRPIGLKPVPGQSVAVQTKAAIDAQTFDTNDVIGLYLAWTEGATGETPIASSLVKNTAWSNGTYNGEPLYWQNTADVHTLYAYYPYNAQADNEACQVAVTLKADQNTATAAADYEAADVLWGKFAGKARFSVPITLGHRMSLVTVSLTPGDGYAEGEALPAITNVTLLGTFHLQGTLHLANGTVTAATGSQTATKLTAYSFGDSRRAILLPGESIAAGAPFIRITTTDGTTYTYQPEEAITTVSNKVYNFTLQLNKAGLSLGNLKIDEWGTSADTSGEADMDIQ